MAPLTRAQLSPGSWKTLETHGCRVDHRAYANCWEFPGAKVEAGETDKRRKRLRFMCSSSCGTQRGPLSGTETDQLWSDLKTDEESMDNDALRRDGYRDRRDVEERDLCPFSGEPAVARGLVLAPNFVIPARFLRSAVISLLSSFLDSIRVLLERGLLLVAALGHVLQKT